MDSHTPEQRHYNMSKVKGKNTKPELAVRKWLWANGYRYRLHKKDLPGKPDIVFSGRKKVIFIHGCFWHKHDCGHFSWPKTNTEFWKKKIMKNVSRDIRNKELLKSLGWDVLTVWECSLKKNEPEIYAKITAFLKKATQRGDMKIKGSE